MGSTARGHSWLHCGLLFLDAGHRYVFLAPEAVTVCQVTYDANSSFSLAASGLYYLSELVEEHTVISKRLLTRLIYFIVVVQLLLCVVDRFPFWLTALGIGSHVVYLGNMRRFPFVTLTDPLFVTSCGMKRPAYHLRSPLNHMI